MLPRVVVVVLTYNDWAETAECLDSLARLDYANAEIVVVDNGSAYDVAARAKTSRATCTLIRNGANLGYAEGNNVGLRYALEHGAEYALVLNNDTVVAPDLLTHLTQAADAQRDAAFVGPMVYHFDEPAVIQSAGGILTADWKTQHRGQNQTDGGQYRAVERVDWVTGCAIMVRCKVLSQIGLLDPDFFIYNEEVDWCRRAVEAGYSILFVPSGKVWHKGVQRNYNPSPRVTYLSARNELLLISKHRAGYLNLTRALARDLRTLTSWSVKPRWRAQRQHRNALAYALRDFARGRYGPPPAQF
jgi:GT2 family glycosyltransferase